MSIEVGDDEGLDETMPASPDIIGSDPRTPELDRADAPQRARPALRALGAFAAYLVASIAIWGVPVLSHLGSRYVTRGGADPNFYRWPLAWAPWAASHGQNLLFTDRLFAPDGVNLTWVATIPGPSLAMTPITLAFGTLASLNILTLLQAPLAAWGAYLVCARVTRSFWPSLAGGFLYGFSAYITGQLNHPNLALIFPVPLAVYLVIRRVEGSIRVVPFVALLSLTLLGLFSISTELFATATVFAALGWVIALAFAGQDRNVLLRALGFFAIAYAIVVAIVFVPYLLPAIRTIPPGTLHQPDHAYDDLLRFVLPRNPTVVGGRALLSFSRRFTAASLGSAAYLGIALVGMLVAFAITERKRRETWGLLVFIILCALLTFGPGLHIAGDRVTGLPTAVIWRLPLIKNAIPDRFPAYGDLAVSVVAALWLSRTRGRSAWARWTLVCVGGLMLIPSIPTPPWHVEDPTPAFFVDGTYRSVLRPDANVLAIPAANGQEDTWQAESDFFFRMPQGYVGPLPVEKRGDPLNRGLSSTEGVVPSTPELAAWLTANQVDAVVVDDAARAKFEAVLRSVGLVPTYEGGGVSVWGSTGSSGQT